MPLQAAQPIRKNNNKKRKEKTIHKAAAVAAGVAVAAERKVKFVMGCVEGGGKEGAVINTAKERDCESAPIKYASRRGVGNERKKTMRAEAQKSSDSDVDSDANRHLAHQ